MLSDCKAEINKFNETVSTIHDIFRFDIPVNDALRMAMLQGLE